MNRNPQLATNRAAEQPLTNTLLLPRSTRVRALYLAAPRRTAYRGAHSPPLSKKRHHSQPPTEPGRQNSRSTASVENAPHLPAHGISSPLTCQHMAFPLTHNYLLLQPKPPFTRLSSLYLLDRTKPVAPLLPPAQLFPTETPTHTEQTFDTCRTQTLPIFYSNLNQQTRQHFCCHRPNCFRPRRPLTLSALLTCAALPIFQSNLNHQTPEHCRHDEKA